MNIEISFSIITVTFNAKKDLLKTINSIQSQNYKFFTHIIKDGFSKDQTNKINYSKYKNTEFYESHDKGIYDAMNQAFKLSKNEYIIFLNAGDIFFSINTLKDLASNIKNNPNHNSYSGATIQINIDEQKIKRKIGSSKLYKYFPLIQQPHPSFVVKKSILSSLIEPFDSNLKIAADYKQQLNLRKKKLWKNCSLTQIISIMPTGGISTFNKKSILIGYKETFIFSINMYKLIVLYIILIKIIFNFYSRYEGYKLKESFIDFKLF